MHINQSYEDVRESFYYFGFDPENGASNNLIKKVLNHFGFSSMIYETYPNQKCMIVVKSLNIPNKTHCIVWNEEEILDPQFENEHNYKWFGPEWEPKALNPIYYIVATLKK